MLWFGVEWGKIPPVEMAKKVGFNTAKYLQRQSQTLSARLGRFDRLYLEFGGKLFSDMHAARVLPGYDPDAKVRLLAKLGKIDVCYCVSAVDLANGRIRGDSGLTYDLQVANELKNITDAGLKVNAVIITRFQGQVQAKQLGRRLKIAKYSVFYHREINGYPGEVRKVLSGYSKQPYIKPTSRIVVVTGAGGGSGKMSFCLSQIFHERQQGKRAGFAKFETFPIWNLPIKHPVNVAYEAATADIGDENRIDLLHKNSYCVSAINYNRDIENFSILQALVKEITGEKYPFGYKSPTDMGVNMVKAGIVNDQICRLAAKQEVIRRLFRYSAERIEGKVSNKTVERTELLMRKLNLSEKDRSTVVPARLSETESRKKRKGCNGVYAGAAMELSDGRIITGKNSDVLTASSAVILNALKTIANIPDKIDLMSYALLKEVSGLKELVIDQSVPNLSVAETLIALASSATLNPTAKAALQKVDQLNELEMHVSKPPCSGDIVGLRTLGVNLTYDVPRI